MNDVWNAVSRLRGRTLPTTTGRSAFTINLVTETAAVITLQTTGGIRPIQRREIEAAANAHPDRRALTPSQVQAAGASEFNSAYVAAIIRAIA